MGHDEATLSKGRSRGSSVKSGWLIVYTNVRLRTLLPTNQHTYSFRGPPLQNFQESSSPSVFADFRSSCIFLREVLVR